MSIYFYVHSIHPFHTPTQQGMLIVIILHFKLCLIGGLQILITFYIVSLCCTNQILDKNNEIWYLLTTTTVWYLK